MVGGLEVADPRGGRTGNDNDADLNGNDGTRIFRGDLAETAGSVRAGGAVSAHAIRGQSR